MQDLIVALYDYPTAVSVRTQLVRDGFPTDRVELTSTRESSHAAVGPRETFHKNVADYFRTLCPKETPDCSAEEFTRAVLDGAATVTVHPRGEEELRRAEAIVERHQPQKVYRYVPQDSTHVLDRKIERAASGPLKPN